MKKILYLLILVATVMLSACGHSDKFVVKGTLTTGASMNLRVIYHSGGNVVSGVTAADGGRFGFEGSSAEDALVEIYDNEYHLLCRVVARNGDDIEVTVNPSDAAQYKAAGNDITERWAAFVRGSVGARTAAARNAAVARYVTSHKSDPLSALLLMTEFDASGEGAAEADSLFGLLSAEARASGLTAGYAAILERVTSATSHAPVAAIPYLDTEGRAKIFKPRSAARTLIAVTTLDTRRDSVAQLLRDIHARRAADVAEFDVDPDTLTWARSVRTDSSRWTRGWVAGSISGVAFDRLGLPGVPYLIIADSTGRQLWRGASVSEVRRRLL